MSVLSVSLEELNVVVREADSVHGQASQLRVTPALSLVSLAMPGGESGSAASRAADTIDTDIASLGRAIEAFSQAVGQSKDIYTTQDLSSSADFSKVNALLEGKN